MDFFLSFIDSLIYLIFPLLIYTVVKELKVEVRYLKYFKLIAILTSYVLFTIHSNNFFLAIFINLLVIIVFFDKNFFSSIVISMLAINYYILNFPITFLFVIIQYIILNIILFSNSKIIKKIGRIELFLLILFFANSFSYFYYIDVYKGVDELMMLILISAGFSSLVYFFKYLFVDYNSKIIELEKNYNSYLFSFVHEVKNPLSVCKGYLDMINSDKSKEKILDYLKIVNSEMNRSLELIADYMSFSKIEVDKDYIDINILLADVDESFSELLKSKKVKLICNYYEDDLIIYADYDKLKQVLVNLIKNSLEAYSCNRELVITVSLKKEKSKLAIIVKDTGIGMDNKTLDNVGNEFFTTKLMGSGVGINYCNKIIDIHEGNMKISSVLDVGTTIKIMLPINTNFI